MPSARLRQSPKKSGATPRRRKAQGNAHQEGGRTPNETTQRTTGTETSHTEPETEQTPGRIASRSQSGIFIASLSFTQSIMTIPGFLLGKNIFMQG